jgi:hypothetical protein
MRSPVERARSHNHTIRRILVIAIAVFLDCHNPYQVSSIELPRLSGLVNDFSSFLKSTYVEELEGRLRRFNERTGYAIVVVVISTGENEQISKLIAQIFSANELDKWGLAGTVLVLITVEEGWVIAEPSQKVEKKFLKPGVVDKIERFEPRDPERREVAVERRVETVVQILDPWFYVLDPPSSDYLSILTRHPTAEVILFLLAPFLGLMTGMVLMAFTAAGKTPVLGRILICGLMGCFVALAAAFIVRQPGGIVPGMVYYSAGFGFIVSALVGALKPYWFTDTVRGRKPGEWIHPPFFGKG